MHDRIFGEITGYPEGTYFSSRAEASRAGIHRPPQGGVSGSATEGADSIVVSGGYEDDRDKGYEIEYGGHALEAGEQVADPEMSGDNLAIKYSWEHNLPIRVMRGANSHSVYAPKSGYRYDGLYRVVSHAPQPGKAGHVVWKFHLQKLDLNSAPWTTTPPSQLPKRTVASKRSLKVIPPKIVRPLSAVSHTPPPPPPPEVPNYNVGDRVAHGTFGTGEVAEVSPVGLQDFYVTVEFTNVGSKKLLASKANLMRRR